MISMVIAIAPLIFILSFSSESRMIVIRQFQGFGLMKLTAQLPGVGLSAAQLSNLSDRYQLFLTGIEPQTQPAQANLLVLNQLVSVNVQSAGPSYFEINGYTVNAGRAFSAMDMVFNRNVIVIEDHLKFPAFMRISTVIGKTIQLGGVNYTIIGVAKQHDSPYTLPRVFIPISKLPVTSLYTSIEAGAKSFDSIEAVSLLFQNAISKAMSFNSNVQVTYSQFEIQQINSLLNRIHKGLIAGACIAFLIGGFGISNIMLVSVRDRTQEIGTLKAIGAENKVILIQFLMEAALIGTIGGILGIIIGVIGCLIVSGIYHFPLPISVFTIVLSFGSAFTLGVVFGFLPAYQASRLNPIEALRTE